jgi:hypothetical protein
MQIFMAQEAQRYAVFHVPPKLFHLRKLVNVVSLKLPSVLTARPTCKAIAFLHVSCPRLLRAT